MQYWIIVNVHWIPIFELPISCHKRSGLLTYVFYCSDNDSKLKDWINFGIYRKNNFAFSALALGLWPWPCPLSCMSLTLALTLALAPLVLLTSLLFHFFHTYRVPICYTDELRKRLVATWAEFQQSGGRCSWSVAKKTGSMYPCRRW